MQAENLMPEGQRPRLARRGIKQLERTKLPAPAAKTESEVETQFRGVRPWGYEVRSAEG
jgi:hypothetical protein